MKTIKTALIGALLVAAGAVFAEGEYQTGNFQFKNGGFWIGPAWQGGEVTYEIGGKVKLDDGTVEQLSSRISQLSFPMDVPGIKLGGKYQVQPWLDLRFSGFINVDDPDKKMTDKDYWNYYEDGDSYKIIESESDVELDSWMVSAEAVAWLWHQEASAKVPAARLGVRGGMRWQSLDWSISNLDQWYPYNPAYGHDTQTGEVGTYKVESVIPYAGGLLNYYWNEFFSLDLSADLIYASIDDKDHHILRTMKSTADTDGWGWKVGMTWRWEMPNNFFLLAEGEWMKVETDGTSKTYVYDGEDEGSSHEIDENILQDEYDLSLSLGYAF